MVHVIETPDLWTVNPSSELHNDAYAQLNASRLEKTVQSQFRGECDAGMDLPW